MADLNKQIQEEADLLTQAHRIAGAIPALDDPLYQQQMQALAEITKVLNAELAPVSIDARAWIDAQASAEDIATIRDAGGYDVIINDSVQQDLFKHILGRVIPKRIEGVQAALTHLGWASDRYGFRLAKTIAGVEHAIVGQTRDVGEWAETVAVTWEVDGTSTVQDLMVGTAEAFASTLDATVAEVRAEVSPQVALSRLADDFGASRAGYYGVIFDGHELSDDFMPETDNRQISLGMGNLLKEKGEAFVFQIKPDQEAPFRAIKALYEDGRGVGGQWAKSPAEAYDMLGELGINGNGVINVVKVNSSSLHINSIQAMVTDKHPMPDVPADWVVMNATRPLLGDRRLDGDGPYLSGRFYAAIDPSQGEFAAQYIERNRCDDASIVFVADKETQIAMALQLVAQRDSDYIDAYLEMEPKERENALSVFLHKLNRMPYGSLQDLADMGIPQGLKEMSQKTAAPYDKDNMDAAVDYAKETKRLFRAGGADASFAHYMADPNGGATADFVGVTKEEFVFAMQSRSGGRVASVHLAGAERQAWAESGASDDEVEEIAERGGYAKIMASSYSQQRMQDMLGPLVLQRQANVKKELVANGWYHPGGTPQLLDYLNPHSTDVEKDVCFHLTTSFVESKTGDLVGSTYNVLPQVGYGNNKKQFDFITLTDSMLMSAKQVAHELCRPLAFAEQLLHSDQTRKNGNHQQLSMDKWESMIKPAPRISMQEVCAIVATNIDDDLRRCYEKETGKHPGYEAVFEWATNASLESSYGSKEMLAIALKRGCIDTDDYHRLRAIPIQAVIESPPIPDVQRKPKSSIDLDI